MSLPIVDPRLPNSSFEDLWRRSQKWDPYPFRCAVLVERLVANDAGMAFRYRVVTNRTRKRFWYEVVSVSGTVHDRATTSSQRVADAWMMAIREAA